MNDQIANDIVPPETANITPETEGSKSPHLSGEWGSLVRIGELAGKLETAGRRLKVWCNDDDPDFAVVRELARGVAFSVAEVSKELEFEAHHLQF